MIGNSTEAINPLTPYKLPVVTSPALLTPTIRSKANKTDLDRPKHWTSSSITPIRAKRPSPSNKTPRKLECNPVTPKSGPSGQLSFRPTFMKSPHTPTPPLLDDDENNHNIISFESPKQIPKVQEKVSHSRKFREGSLSHLFQHILKETEGLQVQFSVSLPHFPLNQISSSISIPSPEKSKDLLNPRNRIKYWVDLTLHSVQKSGEVFLIYNMTIVNFSPGSVYDLTPGSRVQAYFRRDSLKSLGISPSDFSGNMIRVYDFSFFSSPVSAYDQSQSDRYSHHSGGRMILCTQLCEIVR